MSEVADVDVSTLRRTFEGEVFTPGEDRYEEARAIWNGAIDRHPVAIARCAGTDDVAAALAFAREAGLEVSVPRRRTWGTRAMRSSTVG